MEDFEYTYEEDSETEMDMRESTRHVLVNVRDFIHRAVRNDLDDLGKKKFEERIVIESRGPETLEFFIYCATGSNALMANFELTFNNKYPFEAPQLQYKGPAYDFLTNLQLTVDFKKFHHTEWSVRESLFSVIRYILELISNQNIISETLEWTPKEKDFISLLREIDYFKNTSHFEETFHRAHLGIGTGYSKSKDTSVSGNLEKKEKDRTELLKRCCGDFFENSPFAKYVHELALYPILYQFLDKSSFLFVSQHKDFFSYWNSFFVETVYNKKYKEKTNQTRMMHLLRSGKNFLVEEDGLEGFTNSHHFKKVWEGKKTASSKLFRRLFIEILDLEIFSQEEKNFYFAWAPESFQLLKFTVSSENDPYYGGMFEFHVFFPESYPLEPPKVQFVTTGSGTIRFNPNLYADGKVCLSLLGTWSGEQWNPVTNNTLHIIQAIRVMILTDQPIQNEPAYSSDIYYDSSKDTPEILMVKKYKFQIKYHVLRYAIMDHLHETSSSSSLFQPLYREFFSRKKISILESCQSYLDASKDSERFSKIIGAQSFQSNNESIFHDYHSRMETLLQELNAVLE